MMNCQLNKLNDDQISPAPARIPSRGSDKSVSRPKKSLHIYT